VTAVGAVATNLLREVLRSRGFSAVVAILVALAWFLPRAGGELDLLSRLRLCVEYGAGVPIFLIGIVTLVVSTGSLGTEIDRRVADLLVTRPIARWQILLGKLFGVLALDAALLALVAATFSIHVVVFTSGAPQEERAFASERFFATRRGFEPLALAVPVIAPGEEVRVEFRGLSTGTRIGDTVLVRYRFDAVPRHETPLVDTSWREPQSDRVVTSRAAVGRDAFVEFPAGVVGADGSFDVVLRNDHALGSDVRIVVSAGRVEALVAAGAFATTLGLAIGLVWVQLAFLAVVGVCGAANFNLPTAALLAGFVYLVGLVSPFLRESLEALARHGVRGAEDRAFGVELFASALEAFLVVLPDFTRDDPLRHVVEARTIDAGDIAWRYGGALVVRCAVVFGLGALCFGRRELGRPTA